ncbi:MAG: type 1 glutamine amidotransferase [Planctomycetia bacterium]|nr:type 1 glutamine amidotransferase [Planctomycetia bacterium]
MQSRPAGRSLDGVRILALVGDEYEDLELWYPRLRLEEAGAHVTVAGSLQGRTYAGKHGYPCTSDAAIADMEAGDFQGILLPGGWMPDKLRRDEKVLELVREFAAHGKLVAAICHGGWIAISAGVYRGVRVTGSPGIKDDLMNAGAIWEDTPVVIDRHFISSRKPGDLPVFMAAIVEQLATAVVA